MAKLPIVLLLFFCSGFSALVYQIVWQRLLMLFTGAEVVSVTLITAAYMLGMGVGSLVGGNFADRVKSRASQIMVFGVAEIIIGAFGAFSKLFFYDFLYVSVPQLGNNGVESFVTLLAVLFMPTFLMGLTLPFLARAVVETVDSAAPKIASLYAVNTLGAAVGSLVTTLFLVRNLGYEASLFIGAAVSISCGFIAAALGYVLKNQPDSGGAEAPLPEAETGRQKEIQFGFKTWLILSALSGFVGLGLEIVWFRLLSVMLKANSMTYGWLVFLYLTGLAIGTFLGALVSKATRNPTANFCLCQALICMYTGLVIAFFTNDLGRALYSMDLFRYFGQYNPIEFTGEYSLPLALHLYLTIPIALIVPPTVLMGMSFAFLQKAIQNDVKLVGKRLGWLQAANIAGSTGGCLFVGLIALQYMKTSGTLRLFFGMGCAYLFLFALTKLFSFMKSNPSSPILVRTSICCLLPVLVWNVVAPGLTTNKKIWAKLHGYDLKDGFFVDEDRTGIGALRPVNGSSLERMFVYVNGQGHSELPYGLYQSQVGLLPLFLHGAPQRVAIIGLGSGDTFYAAGAHKLTKTVTCFEIVRPLFDCLLSWNLSNPYEPIDTFSTDSRMQLVFEDGRKGLQRQGKKYDIIQQDPLRSFDAGAGMLYSEEYFKMLQRYLEPGGLVVIWVPTVRARRTFEKCFPYTATFGATLIGSMSRIEVDDRKILENFQNLRIPGYCEKTGANQEQLLKEILANKGRGDGFGKIDPRDVNRDLNPKDEFMVPSK